MNEATIRALIRRFGGGAVPDGTYGDITVSGGTWSINANAVDTTEIADGAVTFAKLNGAAVVTSGETIASNDNDTTVPTSAAVKDYVDGVSGWTYLTSVATTAGTEFDTTGIPATITDLEILFAGVSLSGTDSILVQLGTSGGFVSSGYAQTSAVSGTGISGANGFAIIVSSAARLVRGRMNVSRYGASGDTWFSSHHAAITNTSAAGGGFVALGGSFDRIRITRTGTDTFDAGEFIIRYR